jgi:hypothetical protein
MKLPYLDEVVGVTFCCVPATLPFLGAIRRIEITMITVIQSDVRIFFIVLPPQSCVDLTLAVIGQIVETSRKNV